MKRGKYTKEKRRLPIWYWALLILLAGVFTASGWYLANYCLESKQQADDYEDLAALVEVGRPTAAQNAEISNFSDWHDEMTEGLSTHTTPAQLENLVNADGILVEYAPLYEQNPDMAGWICIDGTGINYPVMHTPDRKDYYLRRSFQGEYSTWGCIYAREECDLDAPSDNVTLYGHNMKDGSMFAGLHDYAKQEFWEEHRYIRFDTLTEHHTYEIFGVFRTTASLGQGFAYHEFTDAYDEVAFHEFIEKCVSLSFYSTGILPEYGDKIICLSTCDYSLTNGRLVVAAVRIV